MKMEFEKYIVEPTGRKGAQAFVARRYRTNPKRLEFGYGDTASAATQSCERNPEKIDLVDLEAVCV